MTSEVAPTIQSAAVDARTAGLIYVNDQDPGIHRVKRGSGFGYKGPDGGTIRDRQVRKRIRSIAIPPAWTDVWISKSANGHIQATGRDARGRKQYRYHADFRSLRETTKYDHMIDFAASIRRVRTSVKRDMKRRGLPRTKVVATVVYLLDKTLIRIGNASYARENRSYGLTTLRDRHVAIDGGELRFTFTGKSGKTWQGRMRDPPVARIVRSCQELPGQQLFQFIDDAGEQQSVGSTDINEYLRETTGMDVTAKDFRTWAGTVLAAMALHEEGACDNQTTAQANLREAIEQVAARLGNTPTICRKCYVHPAIIESYLDGSLRLTVNRRGKSASPTTLPEEAAVLSCGGIKGKPGAVRQADRHLNQSAILADVSRGHSH